MRVLAISWAMPPYVFPRALQVSRLLKGLKQQGWCETTVICADLASHAVQVDEALERYYRDAYAVERIDTVVPGGRWGARCARLVGWTEEHLWVKRAIAKARGVHGKQPYDVLVSFAQPWSDHRIGLALKQQLRLPWVAHFSDPWVDSPYYEALPAGVRLAWAEQERAVVEQADKLVFVTEEAMRKVMAKYPAAWIAKADIVPHAFDEALLGIAEPVEPVGEDVCRLVYAGDFFEGKRSPEMIMQAVARLKEKMGEGLPLQLHCYGRTPEVSKRLVQSLGLAKYIQFHEPVSYTHCLALQAQADALLVVDAPMESNLFLSSKLVDYMLFHKPIVALTPQQGTTARIIDQLGFGRAEPQDLEGITGLLEALVVSWKKGKLKVPPGYDAVSTSYRVEHMAQRFATLLRACLKPGSQR